VIRVEKHLQDKKNQEAAEKEEKLMKKKERKEKSGQGILAKAKGASRRSATKSCPAVKSYPKTETTSMAPPPKTAAAPQHGATAVGSDETSSSSDS
jgi:hypothetical protein